MRTSLLVPFAALTLFGTSALAQSSADTVYHLHGTVVNGQTGKGIGRALVMSTNRRLATLTNSEGNWALDVSVPAGSSAAETTGAGVSGMLGHFTSMPGGLILQAQRPGYLPADEQAQIHLDANVSDASIALRLMPASTVRGQVAVAGQMPARGMQVTLLRRAVMDGRYAWTQAGGRAVAADGSFHFADLSPGEYTVQLQAWGSRGGAAAQQDTADQYPALYLGDAATLDAASRLHVGYGQAVQAELHPHPEPFYPVLIPVQGMAQNTALNVRVLHRDGSNSGYALQWNTHDGQVQGLLPTGDYAVLVMGLGPVRGTAMVPLHVAGAPVQSAAIALAPMPDIPVHVRDERTAQSNTGPALNRTSSNQMEQGFSLFVRPQNPGAGLPGGGVSTHDGNLSISGLPPGQYVVQPTAWRGYVASVSSGRVDLLRDPLNVTPSGADPIEVTLRDDVGTVTGTVGTNGGSSVVSTVRGLVMLVASDTVQRSPLSAMVQAGGSFSFSNVPPGTYRALLLTSQAMRNGGVPYRDAEAMRSFAARGVSLSVSAGQATGITLPATAIDAADPTVQP